MNKNKLSWIIAMVLIAAFMIPAANAQVLSALAGVNWYYLLVNATVIFFVLFLLQAVLVPNKEGKEKTSMWIIMLVAAMLIAWLYGGAGYIWKTGFIGQFFATYVWYVVLVNTAVIGVLLYFIFGLLKVNEKLGGNKEGQAGYIILILIISLALAIKLGGNNWIWSQPIVLKFYDYAFGAQGILNPSWGLWTFLGAGFLLSFFFNNYLLKDAAAGNKFVNYGLALLMAANMASAGVSGRAVVRLGEVIFVLFLAKQLETSVPYAKEYGLNWVVAIILVGWASAAATYGTPYQGFLAGLIGGPLTSLGLIEGGPNAPPPSGAGWWGTAGIGALIIGAIVFVGFMISGKGEGKNKGVIAFVVIILLALAFYFGKYSLLLLLPIIFLFFVIFRGENRRRIYTLAVGGIAKRLNAMFKNLKLRRPSAEGREEQVVKENRHIIHANVAYTTRSEITFRYWAVVKEAVATGQQVMPIISKYYDPDNLRKDIILYRSGDGTKKSSEGQYVKGWNWYNREVIEILNEFSELIARAYIGADNRLKPTSKFKPEAVALEALESRIRDLMRELTEAHSKYKERTRAYGVHHILRAFKGVVLTMSNVTGDILEHPQIFARPGAEFIGNNNKPQGDTSIYYGDGFEAKSGVIEKIIVPIHEVNQYGEYVEDINKQKDMLGNLPPLHSPQYKKPRRLKNIKDIIDYPHFIKLMKNIELDWRGLAYDIRWGIYHPKSRTAMSYLEGLKENKYPEYSDEDIHFTNAPSTGDPALDLRALAYPGKNEYWGRKNFDDLEPPPANPFPIVSSGGLRTFLKERIEGDLRDKELAHKIMKTIPADTMAFEKVIENIGVRKVVTQPIGGLLSDEPAAQTKS